MPRPRARFHRVEPNATMNAVDELMPVQLVKIFDNDHDIWRSRRRIISQIVPPAHCIHTTILQYKDLPSFTNAMNLLSQYHPAIHAESTRLLARAIVGEGHHCTLDEWINSGIFFVIFHLHQVRKKLLCLPELLFPDTPIDDYIKVLKAVGKASYLLPSTLRRRDANPNWGGVNWRQLESLVSSPTNSSRLARDTAQPAICGARLL